MGDQYCQKKYEDYEDKVFRELLTNACIHLNHSISGAMIRVAMFSDRNEFIIPGQLPNTITIDKLKLCSLLRSILIFESLWII